MEAPPKNDEIYMGIWLNKSSMHFQLSFVVHQL